MRKAAICDIPAIAELYREQFKEMAKLMPDFIKEGDQSEEFIKNTIADENSDILVCEENGEIVGFILIQVKNRPNFSFVVEGKYCYIMDVIVTENSRGRGIGTELINSAKEWAKERDCLFVNLDVLEKNTRAIELYEKLGFMSKSREMYCSL